MAVREGRDADHLQHVNGAPTRSSCPRELKGQLDVLDRAQGRKELQELEDEPDAAAAKLGQRVIVQGGGADPFDLDVAARREVGRPSEVEEGRLAATAPADDGQPLAAAKVQGNPVEGGHPLIGDRVMLLDVEEAEHHGEPGTITGPLLRTPILSRSRAGRKNGTCIHGLTNVQTVWNCGRIGAVSDYAFG